MKRFLALVAAVLLLFPVAPAQAKPSEDEKLKAKLEKKLDAFEKTYDPSKDLSRKNPEKLDKDIAELDEMLAELKGLDAAAAAPLAARRDTLVSQAKEGVSSAAAGKVDEAFNKHYAKMQESFDPEKKKLENMDAATIKRNREELDRDIAKLDASARKPYEEKRDALFAKLTEDIAKAKLTKQRGELIAEVPPVKPMAGIDVIPPTKPTWCDGVATALADVYSNYHMRALGMNEDASVANALSQAATFSCLDPDFDVRQKWVASFRQTLSNRLGLSASQNERLMKLGAKLAVSRDADKQQKATCEQLPWLKTGTKEVRYTRKLERLGVNCPATITDPDRDDLRANSADVPNGVGSQLAGAVLAHLLTTQGFHTNDGKLTGFAVANAVISFDAAKFEKELAAMSLNDVGTVSALTAFYGMAQRMKALEAEARARNASVLLDAPKKGAQAFVAALAENQAAIDMALLLEEQAKTGSLKGCGAKLYPDLVAATKGQSASLDDIRLDGLLAYKLTLCGRHDPDAAVMERVFGYFAERAVPVRGPFTAAYLALLQAHNASSGGGGGRGGGFDPKAQRGSAPTSSAGPFVPDSNPIEPVELEHNNTINPNMLPGGVVKAVEKQGALTKITFRTEHYMVPVLDCHETNKIDRITSDGTILYRSECKKVGEKEAESTSEPISVPSYAAGGVAAGNFLFYAGAPVNDDVKGEPHRGWIVEAYDSKARKKRTSLFGLAQ